MSPQTNYYTGMLNCLIGIIEFCPYRSYIFSLCIH